MHCDYYGLPYTLMYDWTEKCICKKKKVDKLILSITLKRRMSKYTVEWATEERELIYPNIQNTPGSDNLPSRVNENNFKLSMNNK